MIIEVTGVQMMNATNARKDFSAVIDTVVREKPVFIKRTRDNVVMADTVFLANLTSDYKFTAIVHEEEDSSITLELDQIDLVVNAQSLPEAITMLAQDIVEYSKDYYDNYAVWSKAPNRKSHLPYVIKALIAKDLEEIGACIQCRSGMN